MANAEEDDFQTINESEIGEGQEYMEGQILAQEIIQDDSAVKFDLHKDSVFCIAVVPREPFNVFISGDCDDQAHVWKIVKDLHPALSTGTESAVQREGQLSSQEETKE